MPCPGFQLAVFGFHDNRGSQIALSDNQQTAERAGSKGVDNARDGIVVSRDPMQVNRLYEVSLSQVVNNNNDNNNNNNNNDKAAADDNNNNSKSNNDDNVI